MRELFLKHALFLKHVAVDERDIEGALVGDRIAVILESEDCVHLARQDKMKSRVEEHLEEGTFDIFNWDWKTDPDAGLTMSVAQARELYVGLGECLAEAARQKKK